MRRLPQILEAARVRLSGAIGVTVGRDPVAAGEWEEEGPAGVQLIVALVEQTPAPGDVLLGDPPVHEFEADATLEIIARGGRREDRMAALEDALARAAAALAEDPTLGGTASWAELGEPELSTEEEPAPAGISAPLSLTYDAPSALG